MATGQATEAAKPGWLGNDGNAACRHFFPALKGRDDGGRPPQRDAGGVGVGNHG